MLLAVVHDSIVAEFGQFDLQDTAGFHSSGALRIDHSAEWRMVSGPGGACFHSESNDRVIPVTLQAWSREPDALTGEWVIAGDGIMILDSDKIQLRSVTGDTTGQVLTLTQTGAHNIRAALTSAIDTANSDDYETNIQEAWLLQIWPVA